MPEPAKHYVSHKGKVYVQDVVQIPTQNGNIVYMGRAALLPTGKSLEQLTEDGFTSTPAAYRYAYEAFLGSHELLNKISKLGKYMLGGNPFKEKRK